VTLWDRRPGDGVRQLGRAAALKMASLCSGLKSLGGLVSKHMPAMNIHDVQVPDHRKNEDYSAMELLYQTDAYEYLLNAHLTTKGA